MERKAPRGLAAVASGTRKASRRSLPAGGFPLTLPIRRRSPTASCTQRKSRLVRRCDVARRIRAGACVSELSFFFLSHFGLSGIRTRESKPGAASIGRQARTIASVSVGRRNGGAQHGISGVGGVCRCLVRAGRQPRAKARRRARARLPRSRARLCRVQTNHHHGVPDCLRPWIAGCEAATRRARPSVLRSNRRGRIRRPDACSRWERQSRLQSSLGRHDALPSKGKPTQWKAGSRNVLPRVAAS